MTYMTYDLYGAFIFIHYNRVKKNHFCFQNLSKLNEKRQISINFFSMHIIVGKDLLLSYRDTI